jgi:hypothetical protein
MKLVFQSASKASKVAASMEQATNEQGTPVQAAIIRFTDGSKALVSAKHFSADGTPKFLTEELGIANGYDIQTIQGQPWIVERSNRSNIKL